MIIEVNSIWESVPKMVGDLGKMETGSFVPSLDQMFTPLKGLLMLDQLRGTHDPCLAQVFLLTKILVALVLGEIQWRLALHDADRFCDSDRPVSLWRLTQLVFETFRQSMIGSLTWKTVQKHWPQLQRYLCDPPRRRQSQFANRPYLGMVYVF